MVFGLQDTRFGLLLELLTKGSNVSLLKTSMYITWMNSVPPNCIGKPNKKETTYGYQIRKDNWGRCMESKHLPSLWWMIEIHWDASTEIETLVWICGNLLHTIWKRENGCQNIRDQRNRLGFVSLLKKIKRCQPKGQVCYHACNTTYYRYFYLILVVLIKIK